MLFKQQYLYSVFITSYVFLFEYSLAAIPNNSIVKDQDKLHCLFPNHASDPPAANTLLMSLQGKTFQAFDSNLTYVYNFGICVNPLPDKDPFKVTNAMAGIVQTEANSKAKKVVGKFDSAAIKNGNNWALLEYNNGDLYENHCEKSSRSASVMMLCNENESVGKFNVVEENTMMNHGKCYYLFEFEHKLLCQTKNEAMFGVGAILVIIFFSSIGVYLLVGVLFKKIVQRRSGIEMIPNIAMWQNLGNLIADGCDLVFRSRQELPMRYNPLTQEVPSPGTTTVANGLGHDSAPPTSRLDFESDDENQDDLLLPL